MLSEMLSLLFHAVPLLKTDIVQWEHLKRYGPDCVSFVNIGLTIAREYYDQMERTNWYGIVMGMCGYVSMWISYLQYNSGWLFCVPYMDGRKLKVR